MIDVEADVYSAVVAAIREHVPDISSSSEYMTALARFPHVYLEEVDNNTHRRSMTNELAENHAAIFYVVEVYSNKSAGKKREARQIMSLADDTMQRLGFVRVSLNSIPNALDNTVFRLTARYEAVVSRTKTIYRR